MNGLLNALGSGISTMNSFIGKWVPFARQAIFDETPPRFINSNDFATLIIESGGTGYCIRKTLFGKQKFTLEWRQHDEDETIFFVKIGDGFMVLGRWIEDGNYLAKIGTRTSTPGVTGTGILFRKE